MPKSASAKSSRSNFLLFITDQHRADFLGCYGHPVLRTPHIDSIAARGTAFDRFYVASPVCMPNRASLMTGRMPSVHGVRSNGIPLSMNSVTFVELLRDAGYRTALIGKSHLQNFTGVRIRSSSDGLALLVDHDRIPGDFAVVGVGPRGDALGGQGHGQRVARVDRGGEPQVLQPVVGQHRAVSGETNSPAARDTTK